MYVHIAATPLLRECPPPPPGSLVELGHPAGDSVALIVSTVKKLCNLLFHSVLPVLLPQLLGKDYSCRASPLALRQSLMAGYR